MGPRAPPSIHGGEDPGLGSAVNRLGAPGSGCRPQLGALFLYPPPLLVLWRERGAMARSAGLILVQFALPAVFLVAAEEHREGVGECSVVLCTCVCCPVRA